MEGILSDRDVDELLGAFHGKGIELVDGELPQQRQRTGTAQVQLGHGPQMRWRDQILA